MQYFQTSDIGEEKVVLLFSKNKFEGWCRLINTTDPGLTVYEQGNLLVKQRWLVEWLDIREIPGHLSPADRFTQSSLAGNRTHRYIFFLSNREEDKHKFPALVRKESEFNMNDDFAGAF